MNKVKNRALSVLLLVLAVIIGVGFYLARLALDGGKWASFAANSSIYDKGVLSVGVLTDRNGVTLASVEDGKRVYAENADMRKATLHTVGDASGNIGTGALTVFASKLSGYNLITGTYSRTGEGKTVALTIDAKLNEAAYSALAGRNGSVMVMNYKTGEVLCCVSAPAYDQSNPPEIKDGDPQYEGVYLNRAIQSAYPPGSTFKLITAAAALEKIPDIENRVFECDGSYKASDGEVTCPDAHGRLTLEDALSVSCNCAFTELTFELGADTLASYAGKYGLTEKFSINGIATAAGNYTKAAAGTVELGWSGVGQGGDLVCPAAMLRLVGAVANGGSVPNLSLVLKSGLAAVTPPKHTQIVNKETASRLETMMGYNVKHTYGAENFPDLELYAKSGTAEVGGGVKPHAWFAGYIKNKDYPLAFVVIIENGGSGSAVAGSAANKVLQAAVN